MWPVSASGPTSGARSMLRPVCPANAISARVDEEAAVGAVVVGEDEPGGAQLGEGRVEALIRSGSSTSGASFPVCPKTCARIEPPSRLRPPARSTKTRSVAPRSVRSCGVQVARTSSQGAKAETTSESGATTAFLTPVLLPRRAHRHRVLADGDADAEPRAEVEGHRLHGVEEGGVLAGGAGGRHPVGRELDARERRDRRRGQVGEGLADRHAPGGGAVDDRDRRALAHGEGLARVALEGQQRRRAVGDRHLPRADHRVARAEAADRAVADRDQERLVGHRRVEQDAPDGLGEVDARPPRRGAAAGAGASRPASCAAACRGGPAGPCPPACCRRADRAPRGGGRRWRRRRPRTGSARARTASGRRRGSRARSRGRSAPGTRWTRPRAGSSPAPRWAPRAGRSSRRGRSRGRAPAARSRGRPPPRRGWRGSGCRRPARSSGRSPPAPGAGSRRCRAGRSRSRGRRCWRRWTWRRPTRRPCR